MREREVRRAALVLLALASTTPARADHHGMAMPEGPAAATTIDASVAVLAARFASRYYTGDYQAVAPALAARRGRWAISAAVGLYRLDENGARVYGLGDVVVGGQAALLDLGAARGGLALAVSAPTGDDVRGLGMGHAMVMPSAWATWPLAPVTLALALGYGRALTALGGHDHGVWPLVEPMNLQELTWSAAATLTEVVPVRLTARCSGGLALGAGTTRVIAGLRAAWGHGRVDTALELQAGLIGDPFSVRGVLETAVRF